MKNILFFSSLIYTMGIGAQAALAEFEKRLQVLEQKVEKTKSSTESDIKSLQVRIAQAEQKLNIPAPIPPSVPTPAPATRTK